MSQPASNVFLDFIARYYDDPVGFAINVLHITPDPPQAELLNDIASGERLISVRSGHGTGKSTTLAVATAWFACTRYPYKVVMTAPTSPQLFDALWAETKSLFKKLPAALRPLFEVRSDRIVLVSSPDDCFITARTSTKEKPEALAGVHSANVLLLADEASAIPEEVFESAQGSMSTENATTVLTGNPTRTSGLFYRTHHELSGDWKCHHWSSLDSPRVSSAFVSQIRKTYGEGSNQWRVRVLGEFPEADDEALISVASVRRAMNREIKMDPEGKKLWMVDPARFGNDRTGFGERVGQVVPWIEHKSGLDTMAVAGWVKYRWDQCKTGERPVEILIDVIGIGSGVVDRLMELGLPVVGINVSESALPFSDGYRLRDHLWLEGKKWLEEGGGRLPFDNDLLADLTTPSYSFMSNGKIKVESKDEIRRRGKPSPDLADTFLLSFASEPAVLVRGARNSWGEPVRRNLVSYG